MPLPNRDKRLYEYTGGEDYLKSSKETFRQVYNGLEESTYVRNPAVDEYLLDSTQRSHAMGDSGLGSFQAPKPNETSERVHTSLNWNYRARHQETLEEYLNETSETMEEIIDDE